MPAMAFPELIPPAMTLGSLMSDLGDAMSACSADAAIRHAEKIDDVFANAGILDVSRAITTADVVEAGESARLQAVRGRILDQHARRAHSAFRVFIRNFPGTETAGTRPMAEKMYVMLRDNEIPLALLPSLVGCGLLHPASARALVRRLIDETHVKQLVVRDFTRPDRNLSGFLAMYHPVQIACAAIAGIAFGVACTAGMPAISNNEILTHMLKFFFFGAGWFSGVITYIGVDYLMFGPDKSGKFLPKLRARLLEIEGDIGLETAALATTRDQPK